MPTCRRLSRKAIKYFSLLFNTFIFNTLGFVDFDLTLKEDDVVQIMNTIKGADGTSSRVQMDEEEEREQLFEEVCFRVNFFSAHNRHHILLF
jgi:hypothetical protein